MNFAKSFRSLAAITLGLSFAAFGVSGAQASTDMNGVTGVVFGTGAPNYSITLNCNDLGWGFDDSIAAQTGGSFTINMDDVCVNGAFGNTYYFKVLDDGQYVGDPGYTQNGVHHVGVADSTPIAITGTITVDPDTIIQIRAMNSGNIIPDIFTMHYVGDPILIADPNAETLSHTGFDSFWPTLIAGSLIVLGLGFIFRPKSAKH